MNNNNSYSGTGNKIATRSGTYFDFSNISPDNINILDTFYALPRLNRFVGHSVRPYNVAEHTDLCVRIAKHLCYDERLLKLVFIHDLTEAYTGDCPSPLKRMLPQYSEIEEAIQTALLEKLGLDPITPEEEEKIKVVDVTALAIEMRDLSNHENYNHPLVVQSIVEDYGFCRLYPTEPLDGHSTNAASFNRLLDLANEILD